MMYHQLDAKSENEKLISSTINNSLLVVTIAPIKNHIQELLYPSHMSEDTARR